MKISKVPLLSLLQSVLALVLGFVAVTLVTVAGATLVNAVLPGSVGAEGIPLTAPAQMLFLPILFLAGMSGAFVVVLVTRHRPGMLAVVFGVLAVVGDILAGIEYATLWPLWFSALVVLTVPPQV